VHPGSAGTVIQIDPGPSWWNSTSYSVVCIPVLYHGHGHNRPQAAACVHCLGPNRTTQATTAWRFAFASIGSTPGPDRKPQWFVAGISHNPPICPCVSRRAWQTNFMLCASGTSKPRTRHVTHPNYVPVFA
jgi:hypothetical protein